MSMVVDFTAQTISIVTGVASLGVQSACTLSCYYAQFRLHPLFLTRAILDAQSATAYRMIDPSTSLPSPNPLLSVNFEEEKGDEKTSSSRSDQLMLSTTPIQRAQEQLQILALKIQDHLVKLFFYSSTLGSTLGSQRSRQTVVPSGVSSIATSNYNSHSTSKSYPQEEAVALRIYDEYLLTALPFSLGWMGIESLEELFEELFLQRVNGEQEMMNLMSHVAFCLPSPVLSFCHEMSFFLMQKMRQGVLFSHYLVTIWTLYELYDHPQFLPLVSKAWEGIRLQSAKTAQFLMGKKDSSGGVNSRRRGCSADLLRRRTPFSNCSNPSGGSSTLLRPTKSQSISSQDSESSDCDNEDKLSNETREEDKSYSDSIDTHSEHSCLRRSPRMDLVSPFSNEEPSFDPLLEKMPLSNLLDASASPGPHALFVSAPRILLQREQRLLWASWTRSSAQLLLLISLGLLLPTRYRLLSSIRCAQQFTRSCLDASLGRLSSVTARLAQVAKQLFETMIDHLKQFPQQIAALPPFSATVLSLKLYCCKQYQALTQALSLDHLRTISSIFRQRVLEGMYCGGKASCNMAYTTCTKNLFATISLAPPMLYNAVTHARERIVKGAVQELLFVLAPLGLWIHQSSLIVLMELEKRDFLSMDPSDQEAIATFVHQFVILTTPFVLPAAGAASPKSFLLASTLLFLQRASNKPRQLFDFFGGESEEEMEE